MREAVRVGAHEVGAHKVGAHEVGAHEVGAHEEAVAAIWRAVLGRPDVGVHDDFFDLDGSSLQAVEVVTRVRRTWGVDVRARDFFADPTVAALAAAVAARAPTDRVLVTPRPPGAAPVLSVEQERLWLEDQLLPGAAYNVHERRRIAGALDVGAVERSIAAIRERHEVLRTRFPTVDGAPVQVVEPAAGPAVEVVDLRGRPTGPADAVRLADEQATTAFDLATGPLLRCLLVVLDGQEHVLAVTAHHIVCDNASITVFLHEFVALYRAGGDLAASGLAPLPVQYRDHAVWQRTWLATENHGPQVEYWRRHLAGAPLTLALPTTGRGAAGGNPTARASATLSPEDTLIVGDLCREHGATRFMVVLAALAAVLGRWSGQHDVVVGVPVTGRSDPGVAPLIGFFVNTLALRVRVTPDHTFDELVEQVRTTALAGYAHADVPLDVVVRAVRADDRRPGPLFQVLLSAIDTDDVDDLPGLAITALDPPPNPSRVDLSVYTRVVGGGLRLDLEFDAVRLDPATTGLLVEQVAELLRVACDDPARALADHAL